MSIVDDAASALDPETLRARRRRMRVAALDAPDIWGVIGIAPVSAPPQSGLLKTGRPFKAGIATPPSDWEEEGWGRPPAGKAAGLAPPLAGFASRAGRTGRGGVGRQRSALPGLASGSQAAVVKLASFAGGRARVSALLMYQTRGGDIPVERDDGEVLSGRDALRTLCKEWSENPLGKPKGVERQPSKDVLAFTATLGAAATASEDEIRHALAQALDGHRYAWRLVEADGEGRLHIVMTAASDRRERGRAVRLRPTEASLAGLEGRLSTAFGGDVEVDGPRWRHGSRGASRELSRLTEGGAAGAETRTGEQLAGADSVAAEARAWTPHLRSKTQRDVAHIILSARPGTDRAGFLDAARETLRREFPERDFVFALHEDRRHLHVHAVVRLEDDFGKRLRFGVEDFRRWRQTMAEEARRRDIPMEATSRFEQANTPAYTLSDARLVERGAAPERVRRRVEDRQGHAIHTPTRREGRARASGAMRSWAEMPGEAAAPFIARSIAAARAGERRHRQAVAESVLRRAERAFALMAPSAAEPPAVASALRLYRVERPGEADSRQKLFTRDRREAEGLAARWGAAILALDVHEADRPRIRPARSDPQTRFVVDQALAAAARPIAFSTGSRAQNVANGLAPEQQESSMPTSAAMFETIGLIRRELDGARVLMQDDRRADFDRKAARALASLTARAELERRWEGESGQLQGPYRPPQPERLEGLRVEARARAVVYVRADGPSDAPALVDHGDRIEIRGWKNRETLRAALTLAASKWERVAVEGNPSFHRLAETAAAGANVALDPPDARREAPGDRARVGAPASAPNAGRPAIDVGEAEAELRLGQVRDRLDLEAARERREATPPGRRRESADVGLVSRALRGASSEAEAAKAAATRVDDAVHRPTPVEPQQSPAVRRLVHEHNDILARVSELEAEEAARRREREPGPQRRRRS